MEIWVQYSISNGETRLGGWAKRVAYKSPEAVKCGTAGKLVHEDANTLIFLQYGKDLNVFQRIKVDLPQSAKQKVGRLLRSGELTGKK